MLGRFLHQRLRVDRGLGYEIGAEYVPVSPDHALADGLAQCLPDAARDVEQNLLEAIDDVATRGPSPDDLSRGYQDYLRDMADPRSIPKRLDIHVRDVLLGADPAPEPVADQVEARWRLESEHVASAWKEVRDSMLLLIPVGGVDPQRPLERYPGPPTDPMPASRTFEFVRGGKRRFRHG